MCDICDNKYSFEQAMRGLELRILTYGHAVQGVEPGPDNVTWSYSVGVTESYGLPEFVVTEVDYPESAHLINRVVEQLREGATLEDLEERGLSFTTVHDVHLDGELVNVWCEFYGHPPESGTVLQIRPGTTCSCVACTAPIIDLSDPNASLYNRGRRARRQARRGRRAS